MDLGTRERARCVCLTSGQPIAGGDLTRVVIRVEGVLCIFGPSGIEVTLPIFP